MRVERARWLGGWWEALGHGTTDGPRNHKPNCDGDSHFITLSITSPHRHQ